jgi:hypothetical protein
MRGIIGAGIDHRDLTATNDITDRALIREWAGIVGDDGAHAGRHFLDSIRLKAETLVERKIVVHVRGNPSMLICNSVWAAYARWRRYLSTAQS